MEPNKQLEAGSGASQDAAAMPSNEAVAAGTATTEYAPKADSQGEAGAGAPHISSAQVPSSSDAHEVAHRAGFVDGRLSAPMNTRLL